MLACFCDVTQVVMRSGRAEMFILTGVIKLPANTQAIQLAMVPTTEPRLGSPQLRKVDVQMCCDGTDTYALEVTNTCNIMLMCDL